MRTCLRRDVISIAAILAALVNATPARAQPGTRPPRDAHWQIEAYGGIAGTYAPNAGKVVLPAAGPSILTSNPIFPSRQTPSWFFGDGAALLNDALVDLGIVNRIASLDPAISTPPFGRGAGIAAGLRVRRNLTRRFDVEASVDVLRSRVTTSAELTSAIESARSSFEDAFAALFASGPFLGTVVDATRDEVRGSSRQVALTGALILPLGTRRGWSPHLTVGGGLLSAASHESSVAVSGHYRTVVHAGVPVVDVPIEQFDRVSLRLDELSSVIGIGGGGLTRSIGRQWALHIDGRALIGQNTTRVVLNATPSSTTGTPAGFIELFTFPALEFSNNSSTGRQSTLSGAGLQDFTIFKGTGVTVRGLVTVGVVRRF